jgi:hypothetical protein
MLLNELDRAPQLRALFHISDIKAIERLVPEAPVAKPGYLAWGELLELLFQHKRSVKLTAKEMEMEKETLDKEPQKRRSRKPDAEGVTESGRSHSRGKRDASAHSQSRGRDTPDAYTSDPELRVKEQKKQHSGRGKLSKKGKGLRPKSAKPRKQSRNNSRTWNEGRLGSQRITGQDYQSYYKSAQGANPERTLTVPKPFRFQEREKQRQARKSIRRRKLDEMLEERRIEEDNCLNHQFRANPIPLSTTMPRYETIKTENEARRSDVKRMSVALTKAREKPFSFYARDKDFYVNRAKAADAHIPETMQNIPAFKATPIPWSVSTPLLAAIEKKEDDARKERVKKRAQETLATSKLPPRMEMHETEKRQGGGKQLLPSDSEYTYQPAKARPVPDFQRQQEIFQKTLERHKKQKRQTVPRAPNFRETKARSEC